MGEYGLTKKKSKPERSMTMKDHIPEWNHVVSFEYFGDFGKPVPVRLSLESLGKPPNTA